MSLTGSLVFCMHSSRLSLFCSNHLHKTLFLGQTDCREPSHSHGYTNSYHIMTSSIPSWFIFSQFIFSRKQVCLRKSQKFSPSENFPLYSIMYMYYQKHRYRQFFIGLHSKLTSGWRFAVQGKSTIELVHANLPNAMAFESHQNDCFLICELSYMYNKLTH